ncbi:MAG: DHA2 family efflux MFS transporter permease subunit [Sphingobacteriaceae bacterium]
MESTIEYGFRKWIIAITVIVCSLLELIDTSIVNVAITQLMGNLGATLSEVSWVIAAYGIANVIIVPMTGWLSSQFGRRNYFAASIILFTAASFLCGNSTSIWELVAFRFIQGIGGGALLATSQTILYETFPPEQKGLASALYGIGVLMGPTLGPTIGGYIIDDYNWPYIFYVNIPVGIAAVILTLNFIKNPPYMSGNRTPASQVDWLGIALLIVGVGSLQMILEQGEREDWFESTYITVFSVVALLGIIGFIWRELTAEKPIVDLRVLKNRNLSIGVLFSFILGFGLFSSVFVIPVFVQSILGFTALQTGLMLIPGAIATGFMMPIVGNMIQKGISQKYMIAAGFFIFFCFTLWVYNIITPQAGEEVFFYPLLLRGVGLGLLFVPVTTFSLSALKGKDIATGAGLTAMVRQLGGSFGVAIVSSFIASRALVHRNNLLSHVSVFDYPVQERLKQLGQALGAGGDPVRAQNQAYKILDFTVTKQSFILTYMDTFLYLGIFFLVCMPLVLLIRKTKAAKVDLSSAH